jgi:hypothetical protein
MIGWSVVAVGRWLVLQNLDRAALGTMSCSMRVRPYRFCLIGPVAAGVLIVAFDRTSGGALQMIVAGRLSFPVHISCQVAGFDSKLGVDS